MDRSRNNNLVRIMLQKLDISVTLYICFDNLREYKVTTHIWCVHAE